MIVNVRVPDGLIARLDKLLARRQDELRPIRVTRADLIRQALERGVESLEKRKPKRKT